MRNVFFFCLFAAIGATAIGIPAISCAQGAPAQAPSAPASGAAPSTAAPAPLPTPSVAGPLQWLPPATFRSGVFGKLAANGIVTGSGLWQGNHIPGDNIGQAALSNGQIFIQKPDGLLQFYVQVGAYTLPSLGTPFLATDKTVSSFYGPVPVAFVKLQPAKNTAILAGALPTLIGAEYTFTFENMNIERGLLWNQETAISRGIQINQAIGKLSASISWNDGFYSNRYSWLSGALTYASGPHTVSFIAAGNTGQTAYLTAATPVQNNGSIYNLIYTYSKGAWILQPYVQYTSVPTNSHIGIAKGASTMGGAVLVSHAFHHGFSLPARFEYIASSGTASRQSVNLLFGPGSSGVSGTITPTFQSGGFYVRGDFSWVHAVSYAPGDVFGAAGTNANQPRAIAEVGFIFGNNLTER